MKKLKARGVPIDGIGVQAHLIVGQVPSTFQANLQQFASAGVEVAITELDIRMRTPATQADLAQQQRDYQTVFAACKRVPACVGIQVWGLTDKVCPFLCIRIYPVFDQQSPVSVFMGSGHLQRLWCCSPI